MSTPLHCEVFVSRKLTVTIINDDIINVDAGAVVTGEGPDLVKESFVTQALQRISPSFKDIRCDLKRQKRKLKPWTVQVSALGLPFNYVIHAVLDSSYGNQDWLDNMMTLYRRIFTAASGLPVRALAVPLLGSGIAKTEANLSIQALMKSLLKFSPKYKINVKIVNTNKTLFGMMLSELEESIMRKKNESAFSKCGSKIGDMVGKASDFVFQPALPDLKTNTERRNAMKASEDKYDRSGRTRYNEEQPSTSWSSTTWYTHTNTDQCSSDNRWKSSSEHRSHNYSDFESVYNEMGTTACPKKRESDTELTCPICLCAILEPKQLDKCGHIFCEDCIERSFRDFKPVCPSCNMVYGVITGNQPDGTMDVGFSSQSLSGYPGCGTITITYTIPSGIQQEGHPSPGQPFKGTTRRAYLPDCKEGKAILTLLRIAFDRKLTFTIGRSTTTGQDGVVTWNDIHHKTNMDGGPTRYGYPDPTYLSRVRDELACKGVTDAILSA